MFLFVFLLCISLYLFDNHTTFVYLSMFGYLSMSLIISLGSPFLFVYLSLYACHFSLFAFLFIFVYLSVLAFSLCLSYSLCLPFLYVYLTLCVCFSLLSCFNYLSVSYLYIFIFFNFSPFLLPFLFWFVSSCS